MTIITVIMFTYNLYTRIQVETYLFASKGDRQLSQIKSIMPPNSQLYAGAGVLSSCSFNPMPQMMKIQVEFLNLGSSFG